MTTKVGLRRTAGWGLLLIALTMLAIVIVPAWIIQPFKPQTSRGLAISYWMRNSSPIATIIGLLAALLLIALLWRGARWWRKALMVIVLIPMLASTWFARQNHFEWMFHPLKASTYATASDVSFISDQDMVLSVVNNGEAAAYPVRLMAYHHVVQDVVGGTPIVATY